jgi:hypothetical protein
MKVEGDGFVTIGPGSATHLLPSARTVTQKLVPAGGGCSKDIVCWCPPHAYLVLARVAGRSIPPLEAIERVNKLLRAGPPEVVAKLDEVRVLPDASSLVAVLADDTHSANSRPLRTMVLADWTEVMVLYHELADKLIAAGKPQFACTVYAVALNHNGDFVYDDRFMEGFEAASLIAGRKDVPMLGLPATEAFSMAKERRENARPLPAIHQNCSCVVYYPVADPHGDDIIVDAPVAQPLPALINQAECQWEGVLLSKAFAGQLGIPDQDLEFFTLAAIESLRMKWDRLPYADRKRLDTFAVRVRGKPLSEDLGLELGIDPEL